MYKYFSEEVWEVCSGDCMSRSVDASVQET